MQPSQSNVERTIRVFISSTFMDMQEERDILVKKVFPQLRRMCYERSVNWTEVDLRWGITDEQKAEGQVLPLCLGEIQRCRPYFIGLLGERYGWIPEPGTITEDLSRSHPWLAQHPSSSVTELEICHGVLLEPQMQGHAYFYFRDPRFAEAQPDEHRSAFSSEGAESARRLALLKGRIRDASEAQACKLKEGYATPRQLGEMVLEDFTTLIERLFPLEQVPDPLDQESARHEAYARSRRLAFVGRKDLLLRMNEPGVGSGVPLVVTGASGVGKSALVAEWSDCWRRAHPDSLVIQHYVGCTPDSADWQHLVRRILGEFQRAFGSPELIPLDSDDLRSGLDSTMSVMGQGRDIVLAIDGLDQLPEDGSGLLEWLPTHFPAGFRVLVSAGPGHARDILARRGWPLIDVPAFQPDDIAVATHAYLFGQFGKSVSAHIIAALRAAPAAGNPLFLRTVLDNLRQFGDHFALEARMAASLSAPSLPELFSRVLGQWEDDFGGEVECPDLVRETFCLIACSREGLTESELLDLLGRNGQPLPHRSWIAFHLAAEGALSMRGGLLAIGHEHMRAAVQERWLNDESNTLEYRRRLAEFFEKSVGPGERQVLELPWLLRHIADRESLRACLLNIDRLPAFVEFSESALISHWIWLDELANADDLYMEAYSRWLPEACGRQNDFVLIRTIRLLTRFLSDISGPSGVDEMLLRDALALVEHKIGIDNELGVGILNDLGSILVERKQYVEAEPILRRALAVTESTSGPESARTAIALNNLGDLLRRRNNFDAAEAILHRSLVMTRAALGKAHPDVAIRLSNLGLVYLAQHRHAEAEDALRESVAILEARFGSRHPQFSIPLVNLSSLMRELGRFDEAEAFLQRSLAINEGAFGHDHPAVFADLLDLGRLYVDAGRIAEAETVFLRSLANTTRRGSRGAIDAITVLIELTHLLGDAGRLADAEGYVRQALTAAEEHGGASHGLFPRLLDELTWILASTGRITEAEVCSRQRLLILLESTRIAREQHPLLQDAIEKHIDLQRATGMTTADIIAWFAAFAPEVRLVAE
jgi:nephrocystin-3